MSWEIIFVSDFNRGIYFVEIKCSKFYKVESFVKILLLFKLNF